MEKMSQVNSQRDATGFTAVLPGPDGQYRPCPELLTERELIDYLRIREISRAKDYGNVIDNLKRFHDLPRIYLCGQVLYPREAVQQWIRDHTVTKK
jgi:hypothetical protein